MWNHIFILFWQSHGNFTHIESSHYSVYKTALVLSQWTMLLITQCINTKFMFIPKTVSSGHKYIYMLQDNTVAWPPGLLSQKSKSSQMDFLCYIHFLGKKGTHMIYYYYYILALDLFLFSWITHLHCCMHCYLSPCYCIRYCLKPGHRTYSQQIICLDLA